MNRRKFLSSSIASTAIMMQSLDTIAAPLSATAPANGFGLKVLATNWGFEGSLDAYCKKAKATGYDGIEIWWPNNAASQDELFGALKTYDLAVAFLTAGHEPKFDAHFASFKKMVDAAAGNTRQKPLVINCHSGKDFYTYEQNKTIVDYTLRLAVQSGIKICHETHRSRMLYAAPVARRFFETIPDMRITLDISHWCNVHESLLGDQPETVALAIQRADHIHARVGHAEGPQVNDPRAPEWKAAVAAHFNWWDKIVAIKKANGETLTVLTEFGPPDYMPTEPYTRKPLANQWEINVHMMQLLRKRILESKK